MRNDRPSNIAIFPASLLPGADRWKHASEGLPQGSWLIVLPHEPSATWDVLISLAVELECRGQNVEVREAVEYN